MYMKEILKTAFYTALISVSATYTTIPVTLNKKYTLTATYYQPDNYYVAIDAATPRVKFEKNQCDDPCYFVYDKEIDLRLKYTMNNFSSTLVTLVTLVTS